MDLANLAVELDRPKNTLKVWARQLGLRIRDDDTVSERSANRLRDKSASAKRKRPVRAAGVTIDLADEDQLLCRMLDIDLQVLVQAEVDKRLAQLRKRVKAFAKEGSS